MVAALFAIILGNDELLGVKVKKGRVAYVALENPTDLSGVPKPRSQRPKAVS